LRENDVEYVMKKTPHARKRLMPLANMRRQVGLSAAEILLLLIVFALIAFVIARYVVWR